MHPNTKRLLLLALALCLLAVTVIPAASAAPSPVVPVTAAPDLALTAKSAVLMEASTGTILYQKDPEEAMPPASVTKIMTLLLVMECIDAGTLAWEDTVTASARAASTDNPRLTSLKSWRRSSAGRCGIFTRAMRSRSAKSFSVTSRPAYSRSQIFRKASSRRLQALVVCPSTTVSPPR